MNIESKLSDLSKRIKSSLIRELLKVANDPGMISFGGGVPDPETFPKEKLSEYARKCVLEDYKTTLQYGTTEGDVQLKKQYIKLLKKYDGIDWLNNENIVITVGSQQALYLVGLTFLDEDSYCAASRPIYLGAGSAFSHRHPKFISVPLCDEGMDLDYLETELEKLVKSGEIDKFKFTYAISNFHNPGGSTMSLESRKRLISMAEKYDFLIVEDDPYGALRYSGEKIPSIYSLAPERTLLLNTFSKVLSPGLRMGVVIGPEMAVRKVTMAKQAVDLCSPGVTQRMAAKYMEENDLFEAIKPTIELYKSKRDTMIECLEEKFGDIEGIEWVYPTGGLFIWMTLPEEFDTMDMFELAKENKILYIPSEAFYVNNPEKNKMRLSFCLPSHEDLKEGVTRLKKVIEIYAEKKGINLVSKTK